MDTTSSVELPRDMLEAIRDLLAGKNIPDDIRTQVRNKIEPMIQHTDPDSAYRLTLSGLKSGTKKQPSI